MSSYLDILQMLASSPGTAPDTFAPPMPQPRPTLPGAITAPTQADMAPEVGLRDLSEPTSGLGGYWQRVAEASGGEPFGPVRYIRGSSRDPFTGRTRDSSPLMGLLALATGFANAKAKRSLTEKAKRDLFASKEDAAAAQRQKQRDEAFAAAKKAASETRDLRKKSEDSKRQALTKRAEEMARAINDRVTRAASAPDAQSQANFMADAKRIQTDLQRVLSDPLMAGFNGAGLPVGGLPAMTPRPARPAPILGTVEAKKAAAPKKPKAKLTPNEKFIYGQMVNEKGIKTREQAETYFQAPSVKAALQQTASSADSILTHF